MNLKSVLKPEGSIMASVAVAGTVYAVYSLNAGSVKDAHASDANHPALASARKKAGYVSFSLVSGLFLITRDANVAILGYGSIAAMELTYRHAIMADPSTGMIQAPSPAQYTPAVAPPSNVIQMPDDSAASGY